MHVQDIHDVEYDPFAMQWAKSRFKEVTEQSRSEGLSKNDRLAECIYQAWSRKKRAYLVYPIIKWGFEHNIREFDAFVDRFEEKNPFQLSDEEIGLVYELKAISGTSSSDGRYCRPIEFIPDEVFLLPDIESVSIGGGHVGAIKANLKELPETIKDARSLRGLTLHRCGLTELPSFVFTPWIEYLNVNFNKISIISDSIGSAKSLKNLQIAGNDLEYISGAIGNLKNLESLYVYQNPRLRLPDSIIELSSMKELGISEGLSTLTPAQLKWATENNGIGGF